MIYNIIILPIETIVDWIFCFMQNKMYQFGIIGAIVGVSLAINFLALPLYNIADSLQEKERKIAKSLEYRVSRIKKAFKGNERFMMLSEYYRQNNYHPLYTLRSSLSILIEIPFFIAAYHYLSHCDALKNASFWIFKDLGSPDTFFELSLFGKTLEIHILPILMTLINFVSGAIYTKEAPRREKIQLYAVALIFLVLLYNSPSGLVIYWILNNLFSLAKNVVMKAKNPERILHAVLTALLVFICAFAALKVDSFARKALLFSFTLLFAAYPFMRNAIHSTGGGIQLPHLDSNQKTFSVLIFSSIALALLCGVALPASIIASSTEEFSFIGSTDNPLSYIWTSFCFFVGLFLFWPLCIYKLFGKTVRAILPLVLLSLFVCAVTNAFIFTFDYGLISSTFTLDNYDVLKRKGFFFNGLPLLILFATIFVFFSAVKFKKTALLSVLLISVCIAESGYSFLKLSAIKNDFTAVALKRESLASEEDSIETVYHFSKTEKNVVYLFIDKAISYYFEKICQEFPEIAATFNGFTYYPNTVSFSTFTDIASPAMLAGYDYTPTKINERADELLKDKHNEALLVLPRLFSDAGFDVTVTDPPCSNYNGRGDFEGFKHFPQIKVQDNFGRYRRRFFKELEITDGDEAASSDKITRKEIRNFTVLQVLYPAIRKTFYSLCTARNLKANRDFYDTFSALYYLSEITAFDGKEPTFMFIENETTHEPASLNTDYLTISKEKLGREEMYYRANIATFIQVSTFLKTLKENGVMDNTRIVIVADHGSDLALERFKESKIGKTQAFYNPLLLFKDFNADTTKPLATDYTFMTNADSVFLAKKDLNISDKNPFTQKPMTQEKDGGVILYPMVNKEHLSQHMRERKTFTLDKSKAWFVKDNMLDEQNWTHLLEYETAQEGK